MDCGYTKLDDTRIGRLDMLEEWVDEFGAREGVNIAGPCANHGTMHHYYWVVKQKGNHREKLIEATLFRNGGTDLPVLTLAEFVQGEACAEEPEVIGSREVYVHIESWHDLFAVRVYQTLKEVGAKYRIRPPSL